MPSVRPVERHYNFRTEFTANGVLGSRGSYLPGKNNYLPKEMKEIGVSTAIVGKMALA